MWGLFTLLALNLPEECRVCTPFSEPPEKKILWLPHLHAQSRDALLASPLRNKSGLWWSLPANGSCASPQRTRRNGPMGTRWRCTALKSRGKPQEYSIWTLVEGMINYFQ
jgi:hypothetical protein